MHLTRPGRRARRAVAVLTASLLAAGAALTGSAAQAAPGFVDVSPSHPFRADIDWMVDRGITTGYADGTFQPTAPVTRQAMVAFIARYIDSYRGELEWYEAPSTPTFPDVPTSHPFYREIEYVVEYGIVTGYADGNFHPTATVSRQAAAAFIGRMYEGHQEEAEFYAQYEIFTDVPAYGQFTGYINWLSAASVIDGYSDGSFRPTAPVSRQAASAFLHRADTNITAEEPAKAEARALSGSDAPALLKAGPLAAPRR